MTVDEFSLCRAYGTLGFLAERPSTEVLGYSHLVPSGTDNKGRFASINSNAVRGNRAGGMLGATVVNEELTQRRLGWGS